MDKFKLIVAFVFWEMVGKFHKRNPRKIFNFVYSVRDIGIDGKNVLRIRAGSKGRRPSVAESRERFRHC